MWRVGQFPWHWGFDRKAFSGIASGSTSDLWIKSFTVCSLLNGPEGLLLEVVPGGKLPNPPLQRSWFSLTPGPTPLNGKTFGG